MIPRCEFPSTLITLSVLGVSRIGRIGDTAINVHPGAIILGVISTKIITDRDVVTQVAVKVHRTAPVVGHVDRSAHVAVEIESPTFVILEPVKVRDADVRVNRRRGRGRRADHQRVIIRGRRRDAAAVRADPGDGDIG